MRGLWLKRLAAAVAVGATALALTGCATGARATGPSPAPAQTVAAAQPPSTVTAEEMDDLSLVHPLGCGGLIWRRAGLESRGGPMFFLAELPEGGVALGYFSVDTARPISYRDASGAARTVTVRTPNGVVRLSGAASGADVWQ